MTDKQSKGTQILLAIFTSASAKSIEPTCRVLGKGENLASMLKGQKQFYCSQNLLQKLRAHFFMNR